MDRDDLKVVDDKQRSVSFQLQKEFGSNMNVLSFPYALKPYEYRVFYLSVGNHVSPVPQKSTNDIYHFDSKKFSVSIQVDSSGLANISITDKANGVSESFVHGLWVYKSYSGPDQASGAYIFRPTGSAYRDPKLEAKTFIVKGNLVDEIRVVLTPSKSVTYRIDKINSKFSVHHTVGPLESGEEVVSRFQMENEDEMWVLETDSNGVVMTPRPNIVKNKPEANFFPITSKASLVSTRSVFSVLTDRSVGCGSQQKGQMEVMIHRRTPSGKKYLFLSTKINFF